MNNQPNSPTQPPSDLYSLQTTQIKKITFPIFDKTKLPSSWSNQQRKVLEETALKELEVQQRLTIAIRCAKICLEASLLTQTNDLAYYINKLSDLAETIQRNTKWTKKVYLGGAKPQTLSGEVIFNIEHFIADVENNYHGDCMMPYRRHAANPRRCIHCQGTHASEDHHLSVSVPIVSNSGHTGLSPPQEQTQTNMDNNTAHKHKNTRFALPTQQSAFAASHQQ
jgi:hypothetical protein